MANIPSADGADPEAPKLIAFYLPQFHPIPENDAWWGKGFTEWTNVAKAKPLFSGHYQPRLPADLGFYDLRLPEVREAQAELARQYGIHGFCYYYYFFEGGKQLLERPLQEVLASGKPDFPFCLCWANENWTRRWDGQEQDVLMRQNHGPENNLAFIRSVIPYFKDPRYIRVNGRPLLVIYRANLIPDIPGTITLWKNELNKHGLPLPYLVAAEVFDVTGDWAIASGFDAVSEFSPHKSPVSTRVESSSLIKEFKGLVYDYEKVANAFISKPLPNYPRHRCVTLNWDNTPRLGNKSLIMVNFSLQTYHRWLSAMISETKSSHVGDQRFLFVNAWNEWAEGVYLEPDQLYGHAYLDVTRAALKGMPFPEDIELRPNKLSTDNGHLLPDDPPLYRSVASATKNTNQTQNRLKLVAIVMMGNEADIAEAFVRDNLKFVDHMLIVDHNSFDGTREILDALLSEDLPISVRRIETPSMRQASVTNALLEEALERFSPDWVIPLDSDEFIDVQSRSDFEEELLGFGKSHARFQWVQHSPTIFDDNTEPHPAKRIRSRYAYPPPNPAINPHVWKIGINVKLFSPYMDRYALRRGNHEIVFKGTDLDASAQTIQPLQRTVLRHYPVRSFDQMSLKSGIGMLTRKMAVGSNELRAGHLPKMWETLIQGKHEMADLQMAVRVYLDTGRRSAEALSDTPVIIDPKHETSELLYCSLQQPATVAFLRWINQNINMVTAE